MTAVKGFGGRAWRRYRGWRWWVQALVALFVLGLAAAPFSEEQKTTNIVAGRPSEERLPRAAPPTPCYVARETTTTGARPTTTNPPMATTQPPATAPPTTVRRAPTTPAPQRFAA